MLKSIELRNSDWIRITEVGFTEFRFESALSYSRFGSDRSIDRPSSGADYLELFLQEILVFNYSQALDIG